MAMKMETERCFLCEAKIDPADGCLCEACSEAAANCCCCKRGYQNVVLLIDRDPDHDRFIGWCSDHTDLIWSEEDNIDEEEAPYSREEWKRLGEKLFGQMV